MVNGFNSYRINYKNIRYLFEVTVVVLDNNYTNYTTFYLKL